MGYGVFSFNGAMRTASRVSWILAHDDPGELFVLHACDTPLCVKPSHLHLGTQKDNMAEMSARGRGRKGKP